jgi:hypothetical protein
MEPHKIWVEQCEANGADEFGTQQALDYLIGEKFLNRSVGNCHRNRTMILRLSQKLATKIKAGKLLTMPLNENPYADWSCHVFTASGTQYIILSNTKSLYSCVMYGKGITDDSRFIERALSTIREFMEDDGQAFAFQRFIAPGSGTVSFAKALNRSVIGSMNDLIKHATYWLTQEEGSPHELGYRLNDIPMSALDYVHPKEQFNQLLQIDELEVPKIVRPKDQLHEEMSYPYLAAYLRAGGTLEVGEDVSTGSFVRIRKGNTTNVVQGAYPDFTAILKQMDATARRHLEEESERR